MVVPPKSEIFPVFFPVSAEIWLESGFARDYIHRS
jgi:hypothetical protein